MADANLGYLSDVIIFTILVSTRSNCCILCTSGNGCNIMQLQLLLDCCVLLLWLKLNRLLIRQHLHCISQ